MPHWIPSHLASFCEADGSDPRMWIDPAVGLIGAVVIISWSIGLIRSSGMTLLDMVPDPSLSSRIKEMLELNGDRVSDLHIWRVGPGHSAL
jgi:Co/Zn/Cd efflux system component